MQNKTEKLACRLNKCQKFDEKVILFDDALLHRRITEVNKKEWMMRDEN